MHQFVFSLLLLAVGVTFFIAADETFDFQCTSADFDAFNAAKVKLPYNFTYIEDVLPQFCPLILGNSSKTSTVDNILGSTNLDWIVRDSSCNNDTCVGHLIDMSKILPACTADELYFKSDYIFNLAVCAHVRSTGTITKDVVNRLFREVRDMRNFERMMDDALSKLGANIRTYAPTAVYRPIPQTSSPPPTKKDTRQRPSTTPPPATEANPTADEDATISENNTTSTGIHSSGSGDSIQETTEPSTTPATPRTVPSPAPTSASLLWMISPRVAFSVAVVVVAF